MAHDAVSPESSQEEVAAARSRFSLSSRPSLPRVAKGKRPLRFAGYEAEKSLAKILELACKPLTSNPIHGRPVTTSTLLAKDANHRGVTFTAKMQPEIRPGQSIELFFRCSELVDMITSKFSGEQKELVKPTAFVLVKEKKADGPWIELGQTDSVPHSSEPKFSRPIVIKYEGPSVPQQIQVEVFSHASGFRNGIPIGECNFVLDDLVHARASRVMKLSLTAPDQRHCNGIIVISANIFHEIEDGMWMQLQFAADKIPKMQAAACGTLLPNTYFEIWRQSADGLVQVYRSEVAVRTTKPQWWPLALSGKRLGESSESILWIRFYCPIPGSERNVHFIGQARTTLGECAAGQVLELHGEDPPTTFQGTNKKGDVKAHPKKPVPQPTLDIKLCKWVRLKEGGMFPTEPIYQADLEFMKDAMDQVQLDARTKEKIDECLHFVKARAAYWAMKDILAEHSSQKGTVTSEQSVHSMSDKAGENTSHDIADDFGSASSQHKSGHMGPGTLSRGSSSGLLLAKRRSSSQDNHLVVEGLQHSSKSDFILRQGSTKFLVRQGSSKYPIELQTKAHCEKHLSRAESYIYIGPTEKTLRPNSARVSPRSKASWQLSRRPHTARGRMEDSLNSATGFKTSADPAIRGNPENVQASSGKANSEDIRVAKLDFSGVSPVVESERSEYRSTTKVTGIATAGRTRSAQPQKAQETDDEPALPHRPQTARARIDSSLQGVSRPQSARQRSENSTSGSPASTRLLWSGESGRGSILEVRGLILESDKGRYGFLPSRPSTARSTASGASGASLRPRPPSAPRPPSTQSAIMLSFRQSIRPQLAGLMRQGSEMVHMSDAAPFSSCNLTAAGRFRFSGQLI